MENYSIYLSTEREKYTFMAIVRRAGAVLSDVSGCGSGYHISIQATPGQATRINNEWGGGSMTILAIIVAIVYLPLAIIFELVKMYK